MPTELVWVGGILVAAGSTLVFVLAFTLIRLRGLSEVNSFTDNARIKLLPHPANRSIIERSTVS
jgi:hypothetical protein